MAEPKKTTAKEPVFFDSVSLLERIASLERVIVRIAHNTGTAHQLLLQNGLKPYNPTLDDMSKVKRAVNQ